MDRFCEKLELVFDHFLKYHMAMLFGGFSSDAGREVIFELIVRTEQVCISSNAFDLYLGGALLESWTGHECLD
jgi:hypothetical protein